MTRARTQSARYGARSGFALVTVLWVIAAATTAMLASATLASDVTSAGGNRLSATRAFWRARDCAARARAAIDSVLSAGGEGDAPRSWRLLHRVTAIVGDSCEVKLEAAGSRLDVNQASEAQLSALMRATSPADGSALAEALLDWRDADELPRALGAEMEWYEAQDRSRPRNGPLVDTREILLVRGFESGAFDSLLTVDPARLSLNTAPLSVLGTVAGLSEEILLRIAEKRANEQPIADVLALAAGVSREAEHDLVAHYPEIVRATTVDPDAWLVTAVGRSGSPAVSAFIEIRLVRNGQRSAVVSWRSW